MKHTILTFGPDAGIERDYRRWAYMADNVTADPGAGGAVFRTDDDTTAHWPYVKLAWGPDNTYTIVGAGANAIPIADGGNSITVDGTVAVSGTVTVDLGANNDVTVTSGAITETNSTAILADTANMDTNLGTVAGAVTGTEMQVDVVAALPAGTNAIGKLAANSGVDIGDVDVTSISAGANLVGDVGISGARTSGGTTIFRSIDLDESEEEIKGTAGQVYWIHAMNLKATMLFLKIYNATAATVVVGTTTPVMTIPVATQGDTNGAGFVLSIPNGIAFGTAITVACTTGIADADTGAPGANEMVVNIGYA